jgi:hypothetical protein
MTESSVPTRPLMPQDDRRREPLAKAVWAFHRGRHHHQALDQLRRARRLLDLGFAGAHECRRVEDRVRLERHNSSEVTIKAGRRV